MDATPGFRRFAVEAFGFLVDRYALSLARAGPTKVVFEGKLVRVEVAYDADRSFELDVIVTLLDELAEMRPEPGYRLREILSAMGAPEASRFEVIQVEAADTLERSLHEMAAALDQYAGELLLGSVAAFRRVGRTRDEACRVYRDERELANARARAAEAWRAGRYAEVVQALSTVASLLSPSDIKRLRIARRRMTAGS
jgi:hypothetical protein